MNREKMAFNYAFWRWFSNMRSVWKAYNNMIARLDSEGA